MKILFVSNFCPHYRVATYELLARKADTRFVFFSAADEWYWGQAHGRQTGNFPHVYLKGFTLLPRLRITPGLVRRVWRFDGDVIIKCINGRFALPVTLLLAKLRGKPFVLWTGMWQHPRTLFHRLTYPVTRLVYRMADAIVVYGDHVRAYLVGLGIPDGNVFTAPHAVDNDRYGRDVSADERSALLARFHLTGRRVVLYVGRLEESKGVADLLDAFSQAAVPDSVLLLVGQGTERGVLERRAVALGLADRVVFAGYLAPDETIACYAVADALVVPSVRTAAGAEPWGLVVNEALAQGTPVIATGAVGAAAGGLVRSGVNGQIVAEHCPAELADAIRLVLGDKAYQRRLIQGARETVAGWSNEMMVAGFLAAARHAFGRRAGATAPVEVPRSDSPPASGKKAT